MPRSSSACWYVGPGSDDDRDGPDGDDVHQLGDALRASGPRAPGHHLRRPGAEGARPVGVARRGVVRPGRRGRCRPALGRPPAHVGRQDDPARPEPDAQGPSAQDGRPGDPGTRTERGPHHARRPLVARVAHRVGQLAAGLPRAARGGRGGRRPAPPRARAARLRRRRRPGHDPDHARGSGLRRGGTVGHPACSPASRHPTPCSRRSRTAWSRTGSRWSRVRSPTSRTVIGTSVEPRSPRRATPNRCRAGARAAREGRPRSLRSTPRVRA